MSPLQRFFIAILPTSWAASMKAESSSWIVRCACGWSHSIWDLGGIRWKAAGRPRRYMRCPRCGEASWHTVNYESPAPQA